MYYLLTTGKAEALHQVHVCPGPICPSHLCLPGQIPARKSALLWLCQCHAAPVWQRAQSTTDKQRGVCNGHTPLISQLYSVPAGPADTEGVL